MIAMQLWVFSYICDENFGTPKTKIESEVGAMSVNYQFLSKRSIFYIFYCQVRVAIMIIVIMTL